MSADRARAASRANARSESCRRRLRMRPGFGKSRGDPAPGFRDGGLEPLAPVGAHVLDDRHERAALRRQRVLDAWWNLGERLALDDALFLERAQPDRQG